MVIWYPVINFSILDILIWTVAGVYKVHLKSPVAEVYVEEMHRD